MILEVVIAAAWLLATAGLSRSRMIDRRRRGDEWLAAAEACGLTDIAADVTRWRVGLTARADHLTVRLAPAGAREEDGRQDYASIVTVVSERPFHHVTLRPETLTTAVEKGFLGAREIELGDPPFDAAYFVGGTTAAVRAALDEKTRRILCLLSGDGLEVSRREVRAHARLGLDLARVLRLTVDVARRLTAPLNVVDALAENARLDSAPAVRVQNLLCLMREFPEHPRTRDALRTACSDPSAEMRLRAAGALGPEGIEILTRLAEGPASDDVAAARAVYALGRRLPLERLATLLERSLRSRRLSTARACLEGLAHLGDEGVARVVKVLGVEAGELAVAAAQALAGSGSAAVEAPLLAALERDVPGLRAAAALALGHIGSVASVLPLKEAMRVATGDRSFQRAARQAVAEIQARAAGATPGQLSLAGAGAGAEQGQLSIADESGRVSFAEAGGGRVSLAPEDDRPRS
jgi:hypothetical protein